jgi:hypothetical protein
VLIREELRQVHFSLPFKAMSLEPLSGWPFP